MKYSDLTVEQRERVTYLFADTDFQTDPACFDYEANRDGEIVGRIPLTIRQELKGGRRSAEIHISARPEPHPTKDMIRNADLALSGLADVIVQRIMSQSQQEIRIDQ